MTLDCVQIESSLATAVRRFWWLEVSVCERQPSKLSRQLQSNIQCNLTGHFRTSLYPHHQHVSNPPASPVPIKPIRYYKADARTLSTSTFTKPPPNIDTHSSI